MLDQVRHDPRHRLDDLLAEAAKLEVSSTSATPLGSARPPLARRTRAIPMGLPQR